MWGDDSFLNAKIVIKEAGTVPRKWMSKCKIPDFCNSVNINYWTSLHLNGCFRVVSKSHIWKNIFLINIDKWVIHMWIMTFWGKSSCLLNMSAFTRSKMKCHYLYVLLKSHIIIQSHSIKFRKYSWGFGNICLNQIIRTINFDH